MDVEHAVNSAIIHILRDNMFYGHIICQLPKVYTNTVDTFAVGKIKGGCLISLFINPEYIEEKYRQYGSDKAFNHICQVIHHEILHVIFKHLWIDKPNKTKLMIACECSVNSYIDRTKLLDKCVFAEDFGLPRKLGVEEYYNKLNIPEAKTFKIVVGEGKDKWNKDNSIGSNSIGGDDSKKDSSKKSKTKEKEKENASEEITVYVQDPHDKWEEIKNDKVSQILLNDIIRKAKELAEKSNQWGKVPSEIRETVCNMLEIQEEKISWETALRDFISSSSETLLDHTNKKVSKRFGTRPGTKKEDKLKLAIGIDTSGSISTENLKMFFSELYWISKQNVDITVFECDCQIGREYPFEDWDETENISGGGGTNLEPVIKETSDRKFDALIYFTDAYAPKIETDYNIPILLVVTECGFLRKKEEMPCKCNMMFHIQENGDIIVE